MRTLAASLREAGTGEIHFPAFDQCVTAMGLGESVLEFNPLMVKA